MELTTQKKWNLTIKGITCEIIFWTNESMKNIENESICPRKGIWNSYIYINKQSIPRSFNKLVPEIKKTNFGIKERFCDEQLPIEMAYGVTFFDVARKPSGDIVGVKIGNDYNHLWNENQCIDENTIKKDLEELIEKVYKTFPSIKVRSHVDGKYVKFEELEAYNKKRHAEIFCKPIRYLPLTGLYDFKRKNEYK